MDAILIQQVLINILENAVQHAKGMVHLGLKVFLVADKAVFEVQDDGCGIPEEKLKSVFTGVMRRMRYLPIANGAMQE